MWWLLNLEYRWLLQWVLIFLTCISMLRWGGGPERALASIFLGSLVIDRLYHALWGSADALELFDAYHTFQDGMVAIAFLLVALYANRFYPMAVAALQLIALIGHFMPFVTVGISGLVVAIVTVAPSWGILFAMMAGMALQLRRKRGTAPVGDWRKMPAMFQPMAAALGANRRARS